MSVVSMKQLLEAGVHFGHQTRRWNPKMAEYVHLIVRNTKNWSNSELRKKCKIESIDAKGTDAGDGSGDNGGGSGNTTGGNTTGGTDDGKTDPGNTDSGNTDSGKTDGGGSDSNGDNEHIVL